MNSRAKLITALSILALGGSSSIATAAVEYSEASIQQCLQTTGTTEAECACSVALEDGSEVALASFLSDYADEAQNTACAALAQTLTPPGSEDSRGQRQQFGGGTGGDTGGDGYGG